MRFSILFLVALTTASPLLAAEPAQDAGGIESLGNELLEGLDPIAPTPPANSPQSPSTPAPPMNDLGEDIGKDPGSLPLVRVRQGMQQAESLLAAKSSPAGSSNLQQAGQAQQQVVDQLDALIAELSKQCQNGQCQPNDQPSQSQKRSQSKPGQPRSAAGRGQTAARESSDRLNQANAKAVDKGDVEALVKDLWGHLPERTREQMMQSYSEEFLPEYELEIEEYYRRLSEDDDHLGPN